MPSQIKTYRIVLIDIADPHRHVDEVRRDFAELRSLVNTYGGIDIVHIIQHRTKPDKATYIGSGKVLELVDIVRDKQINIVVINAIVNASLLFNLTQILWKSNPHIQVWDRVDLILQIFKKHSTTAQAKLQIEIAEMNHMGPRIYGLGGTYFSRQGGGIGGRGIGETNIELMKRHWRDHIKKKRDELAKLEKDHWHQVQRRKVNGIKTVSIIGYTNAGKTTLFNHLTKKNKVVKNALFVTLDSSVGKLYLPKIKKEIFISDTIGFIKNLPSSLIDSFKSTLMESIMADLLIQVIDITDPQIYEKMDIVENILTDLKIVNNKRIFVFNKIDLLEEKDVITTIRRLKNNYPIHSPQFISVKLNVGIENLLETVSNQLFLSPPDQHQL